jgi:hypothetical protein
MLVYDAAELADGLPGESADAAGVQHGPRSDD